MINPRDDWKMRNGKVKGNVPVRGLRKATNEEDQNHNVDYWLFDIPIQLHRRMCSMAEFGQVAVRKKNRSDLPSEADKIMSKESWAELHVYHFTDGWVACTDEQISLALYQGKGSVVRNDDGSEALYININDIPGALVRRRPKEGT